MSTHTVAVRTGPRARKKEVVWGVGANLGLDLGLLLIVLLLGEAAVLLPLLEGVVLRVRAELYKRKRTPNAP